MTVEEQRNQLLWWHGVDNNGDTLNFEGNSYNVNIKLKYKEATATTSLSSVKSSGILSTGTEVEDDTEIDIYKIKLVQPEISNSEPYKYWINSTPEMPDVEFQAKVEGLHPIITNFTWNWSLKVWYQHLGTEYTQPYFERIKIPLEGEMNSLLPESYWRVIFGGDIIGGYTELKVKLRAISNLKIVEDSLVINNMPSPNQDETHIEIMGQNPSKQTIRDRLGSIMSWVICYKETQFLHFRSNGKPVWGWPSGYGVMQLDPPYSYAQEFDWRANVDGGLRMIENKRQSARGYPSRVRTNGDRWRHQPFPDATDFIEEELKMDTYQLFNGGHYYIWDNEQKKWIKNPYIDNTGYAEGCKALEEQIINENYPDYWN